MQTASVLFRPAPLALALAFLLLAVAALQAAEMAMLDSIEYDVYHKGKKIGRMSYSIFEQAGDHGPLLKTRRSMEFGVRFLLLLKISVEAREETLRNEDGTYSFPGKVRPGDTPLSKKAILTAASWPVIRRSMESSNIRSSMTACSTAPHWTARKRPWLPAMKKRYEC